MNKLMQTQDLIGQPLDQAVAVALGYVHYNGPWWHHRDDNARMLNLETFAPSVNGAQGQEIIESSWIGLDRPSRGQTPPVWRALSDFKGDRKYNRMGIVVSMWGPTALIAAMRCKVASVYGDTIELDLSTTQKAA